MSRSRRGQLACATIGFVATIAAGCGVSSQSTPQLIDPSDVPFGLMQSRNSTATSVPAGATSAFGVYFVGVDGLAAVAREVGNGPTPSGIVAALMGGPTAEEAHAGLRSALVPGVIDDVGVADGEAIVDLDVEFLQLGRVEQAFAIAQIVFTLTGLDGVDRVRLVVDGEPLPVAQVNGRTTTAPIGREDVIVPEPR